MRIESGAISFLFAPVQSLTVPIDSLPTSVHVAGNAPFGVFRRITESGASSD
jgi:hypothetical protein